MTATKGDSGSYQQFDRSRLRLRPLSERRHLLNLGCLLDLAPHQPVNPDLAAVAERIRGAKASGAAVVLMMGAHVLRAGVQRFLIDLIERGFITCLAMNGAGVIHDFEFALAGATTESVAHYIENGQFGLWRETGLINDIVAEAARRQQGLGEAVGRYILEQGLPHQDTSLLAAGFRCGVPVTVHVGLGYDILHEHPNCDGAAFGQTSYTDFLRLAHCLLSLEGGVVMNFGSAVMAPEVYLKALAMVRNVVKQEGRHIRDITTLVCDLLSLPASFGVEASREEPGYYFRPWKTMLIRTVAGGGRSYYVRGPHGQTIPQLWTALRAGDGL